MIYHFLIDHERYPGENGDLLTIPSPRVEGTYTVACRSKENGSKYYSVWSENLEINYAGEQTYYTLVFVTLYYILDI